VSKARYPYPDDEFDVQADPDGPRGVHRAPRSAWSRWWPFLLALVVIAGLTFGAVYYWNPFGSSGTPSGGTTAGEPIDVDIPEPEPAPTEPTDDEPEPTEPEPVLTTPVQVLNAARIQGLAATAQSRLTSAGFTEVTADNTERGSLTTSTVFYGAEDLRPTAELVASTLGLDEVSLDTRTQGIRVVLLERLS